MLSVGLQPRVFEYQALQPGDQRLQTLQQGLSQSVGAYDSVDAVYHAITQLVQQTLPAASVLLARWSTQPRMLDVAYHTTDRHTCDERQLVLPRGWLDQVQRYGQVIWERQSPALLPCCSDLFDAGMLVPLRTQTLDWGMLLVQHHAQSYTTSDLVVLKALASTAALMLETTKMIAELRELAHTDPLTGLLNRRAFGQRLEQELHRAQRQGLITTLMLIDIDYFKTVNDTYGHSAGDHVLNQIAQVCRQTLRASDVIGRYGGEEFVILLPATDQAAAMLVAERLRQRIAQHEIDLGHDALTLTASLGVVVVTPFDTTSPQQRLDQADQALYRAKQQGRNRVEIWQADHPLSVEPRVER
jgi:diguanylate cyclase (GGDEF)-like protein